MTGRSGPFWDGVEGRAPLPRAVATLGLEVLDANGDNGTVELAFTATEDFTNPAGNVLGDHREGARGAPGRGHRLPGSHPRRLRRSDHRDRQCHGPRHPPRPSADVAVTTL
jgi:hypothetical protein